MAPKRTYVDSCLLIAAFRGEGELGQMALEILDDPDRTLVVSDAVWLEVMPKPRYNKQQEEAAFYEAIFDEAENISWDNGALAKALGLAEKYGVAAMDAIHIGHAIAANADELVSAEKPTKPMFRVPSITMSSIRSEL